MTSATKIRTVRELGGEIWAEITMMQNAGDESLATVNIDAIHKITDVTMGVLARYTGYQITNDTDLPVTPLPKKDGGD